MVVTCSHWGLESAHTTLEMSHTVSFHDIVCDPDANTKVIHVRALSDWMKVLLLTAPSEANMRTLLESQGDPHLTSLSPKQHSERQKSTRITLTVPLSSRTSTTKSRVVFLFY